MFVTVDRKLGQPVNAEFKEDMALFLDRFRLAGYDIDVDAPLFVPLDIALTVCVTTDHFRSNVKQALLEVFSNRDLPDGRRGFFHPDNFTFGQPVYLSKVLATAMQVPGAQWVDADELSPSSIASNAGGRLRAARSPTAASLSAAWKSLAWIMILISLKTARSSS